MEFNACCSVWYKYTKIFLIIKINKQNRSNINLIRLINFPGSGKTVDKGGASAYNRGIKHGRRGGGDLKIADSDKAYGAAVCGCGRTAVSFAGK